ncbi:uncharacterized protein C8Q71DRAFT_255315 [Rhodofomes roseus]|uniref:F-box domain-containing protein n=1 Tax=Rhodofomes roseus TaxID=34475 RepID=A0ABQ8K6P8_9APHY|nr:uncharacterized protein C8Q71DRAFT_255315 [Rhodofomes roseus]KAH9832497.1 hypothetical protein C8Q71DRAFT_255315 [Rhodofomes roseus]
MQVEGCADVAQRPPAARTDYEHKVLRSNSATTSRYGSPAQGEAQHMVSLWPGTLDDHGRMTREDGVSASVDDARESEVSYPVFNVWSSYYRDGGLVGYAQYTTQPTLVPLSRALSDRIPLEVILEIANALSPGLDRGTETLLSMMLVCASWYPYCMRVLYRNMVLRDRGCLPRLVAITLPLAEVRRHMTSTQSLVLGGKNHDDKCPISAPLVLGGLLPSLIKLELNNLRVPIHPSFFRALPRLATVTDLRLLKLELHTFHELRRIICAFPRLLDLTVGHIAYALHRVNTRLPTSQIARSSASRAVVRLRTLTLDWSSHPQLLIHLIHWLTDCSICDHLYDLALNGTGAPIAGGMRIVVNKYFDQLLQSAGPSIKRLTFGSESHLPLPSTTSLKHCTNLQYLAFKLSEYERKDIVDELLFILGHIRSNLIDEIAIITPRWLTKRDVLQLPEHPEDIPLGLLHKCQLSEFFARLRVVDLRIGDRYGAEEKKRRQAVSRAQRLFAPWNERGILKTIVVQ